MHNFASLVLRPPGVHDAGLAPDEDALKGSATGWPTTPATRREFSYQLYDTSGHDRGLELRGRRHVRLHDRDGRRRPTRAATSTSQYDRAVIATSGPARRPRRARARACATRCSRRARRRRTGRVLDAPGHRAAGQHPAPAQGLQDVLGRGDLHGRGHRRATARLPVRRCRSARRTTTSTTRRSCRRAASSRWIVTPSTRPFELKAGQDRAVDATRARTRSRRRSRRRARSPSTAARRSTLDLPCGAKPGVVAPLARLRRQAQAHAPGAQAARRAGSPGSSCS